MGLTTRACSKNHIIRPFRRIANSHSPKRDGISTKVNYSHTSLCITSSFQFDLISTMASTSTLMSSGSVLVPMADRAWYPASLPNTCIIKSEHPSITKCCSLKPSVDWTIPNTCFCCCCCCVFRGCIRYKELRSERILLPRR